MKYAEPENATKPVHGWVTPRLGPAPFLYQVPEGVPPPLGMRSAVPLGGLGTGKVRRLRGDKVLHCAARRWLSTYKGLVRVILGHCSKVFRGKRMFICYKYDFHPSNNSAFFQKASKAMSSSRRDFRRCI